MISWTQVRTIARREYTSTVRRKAFIFTALGLPAYFALVTTLSIGPQMKERVAALKELQTLGVVDSSGLYANAPRDIATDLAAEAPPMTPNKLAQAMPTETMHTAVKFYPDWPSAEQALRSGGISQLLVIPADYLARGDLRRYARASNLFTNADRRPITTWLVQGLVGDRLDSLTRARVARPTGGMDFYALNKAGEFELKDDRRDIVDFLLPFAFGMLLGLSITIGGQYLLQGVTEEKESRILESLLCNVSPEELLAGKLVGLGSVGLTVIAIWIALAMPVFGGGLLAIHATLPQGLLLIALAYFLLGYTFYGSIMTGIGSMASNMREAQQFSVWLSFANFVPFLMMTMILGHPGSPLAVGLSLFPMTAATTMMLRLTAPSSAVPPWQIALSLGILAATAWIALRAAARIFRIGLLLYGKTPNLPEILRWARKG